MKKIVILILLVFVAGCSGKATSNYYALVNSDDFKVIKDEDVSKEEQTVIYVLPVKTSDPFENSGIIYQTSDVEYSIASANLWVSPLRTQLQNNIVQNLRKKLPMAVTGKKTVSDITVELSVENFNGRYDGNAVVRGEWQINCGMKSSVKSFNYVNPLSEDGYPALVRSLSKGWQDVAQELANDISSTCK